MEIYPLTNKFDPVVFLPLSSLLPSPPLSGTLGLKSRIPVLLPESSCVLTGHTGRLLGSRGLRPRRVSNVRPGFVPLFLRLYPERQPPSPTLEKGVRAPRMLPCHSGIDLLSEHVFLIPCFCGLVDSKLSNACTSNSPL